MNDATPEPRGRRRLAAIVVPILVALGFLLALRAGRPGPARRPDDRRGLPVRVLAARALPAVPRAVGYGVVQAAYEWELVAEVSGRVTKMNPDLRVGAVLPRGASLLEIDAQNYRVAEKQREASLQGVRAQMRQLELQRDSVKATLSIERQSLALAERELGRTRSLFATGSVTQADVDGAQRNVLAQRSAVQGLENQLREIPASMAGLQAQLQESKAGLEGARLDLGRTEMVAPFDIRIRQLSIQPRELVTAGQILAVADGIDAAEIPAQLTLGALRALLDGASTATTSDLGGVQTPATIGRQLRDLDLRAVVRLESSGTVAEWQGEVTRIANVDSTTRTIGVVVSIVRPVGGGHVPLLLSGMYVEVELMGRRRERCLAVPGAALHPGNTLHVVGTESRLERREVALDLQQASFACVSQGIAEGEQVIISDVQPAIQGMLVLPVVDEAAAERLSKALSVGGSDL